MSKKAKKNVINHIDNINLEIDYDKLASAIVKSQNENHTSEKKTKRARNALLGSFNGMFYAIIYSMCFIFITYIWYSFFKENIYSLFQSIIFSIPLIIIGIFSFLCQQETFSDSYSDSIDLFNTNISLIALVIAIIALLKS